MTEPLSGSLWDLDDSDSDLPPAHLGTPDSAQLDASPASYAADVMLPSPVRQSGALTPTASKVLGELLDLSAERPVTPPSLTEDLRAVLDGRTHDALETWPERSLWVSKAALFSVERCEASFLAGRASQRSGTSRPVAVGQVAHRAIQIAHTHPGLTVDAYVRSAVVAQCDTDQSFSEFWSLADISAQSDVLSGAVSRVTSYLDSWPTLLPEWAPRFEDPLQVRVGKLTLSARPDLVMGRPRADLRQTMLLCDFKTGDLKDEHEREASFYALVSALRHGVAPYRSCVYSLSSGEWVAPSVEPAALLETAEWVGTQVVKMVEVLQDRRPAVATVNAGCTWCPLKTDCGAFLEDQAKS